MITLRNIMDELKERHHVHARSCPLLYPLYYMRILSLIKNGPENGRVSNYRRIPGSDTEVGYTGLSLPQILLRDVVFVPVVLTKVGLP